MFFSEEKDALLRKVQHPARYTGGEYNEVIKNLDDVDIRFALCFPDTYEIGMSNMGIRILYGLLNDMSGVWCERVFAPWGDMEDEMRKNNLSLWALESGDDINKFDFVAFSLGYEMAYTSVLDMLDLGNIPLKYSDRKESDPIVICGGACVCNIEPMADFFDLCIFGEGEEVEPELLYLYRQCKKDKLGKKEFLKRASKIGGIYVPSLYEVSYKDDGTIEMLKPLEDAPAKIQKRIVEDFDNCYFPLNPIVPSTEIVHDRVSMELFRGCIRGCRFCQAGYTWRPVRSRSTDVLQRYAEESLKNTGYQEINLSSLSSSDYPQLSNLCDKLLDYCEPKGINLSLPSLRADHFSHEIMEKIQKVRKSGLTFAPEAGTQRLRDVINKNVTEQDLLDSCRLAFESGRNSVKLYFMLGLPTENDDDVIGIADLANKVYRVWKEYATDKRRGVRITVSTSEFVPKPHTPFQWAEQISSEEYLRRVHLLLVNIRNKSIIYNWHDEKTGYVEAALARGDRKMSAVIEEVWRMGGKLEGWSEYFDLRRWQDAFVKCDLNMDFYATRLRNVDEILPWDHMDCGVRKQHLIREWNLAFEAKASPNCREQCLGCGASSYLAGGVCNG